MKKNEVVVARRQSVRMDSTINLCLIFTTFTHLNWLLRKRPGAMLLIELLDQTTSPFLSMVTKGYGL
jgi:hypothetical protein